MDPTKHFSSTGVLTEKVIEDAAERARSNFGRLEPDVVSFDMYKKFKRADDDAFRRLILGEFLPSEHPQCKSVLISTPGPGPLPFRELTAEERKLPTWDIDELVPYEKIELSGYSRMLGLEAQLLDSEPVSGSEDLPQQTIPDPNGPPDARLPITGTNWVQENCPSCGYSGCAHARAGQVLIAVSCPCCGYESDTRSVV
jgi:hypothetical protein